MLRYWNVVTSKMTITPKMEPKYSVPNQEIITLTNQQNTAIFGDNGSESDNEDDITAKFGHWRGKLRESTIPFDFWKIYSAEIFHSANPEYSFVLSRA